MKRILIALVAALALTFACAAQTATKKAPAHKTAPAAQQAQTAHTGQIDINTATPEQLKAIPGIGDAYAAKIVQARPYKSKYELVQKKILPKGVYDKVKDQIIARQPK